MHCFGPAEHQCLRCAANTTDDNENNTYIYQGRCYYNACPAATYRVKEQHTCLPCQYACA